MTVFFERIFNLERVLQSGDGCLTASFNGCLWLVERVYSKFYALFFGRLFRVGS